MTTALQHPLVAIVTPVYNGAEFLAEAMESVQAQTYPNLVHIVLDNASTDATPDIIASFRNRKIPVVVSRNAKLLNQDDNWNTAVGLVPADAAYFSIVCADDMILPEAIARSLALAESDPSITMVTCPALFGTEVQDIKWPKDRTVFPAQEALRRFFTDEGVISTPQLLVRADMLREAKPFFDVNSGYAADTDAALRCISRGSLGVLHEPVSTVRMHADSITSKDVLPLHQNFCDWLIFIERYGPLAFTPDEYRNFHRRYRRYYLRRMLSWRWKQGNRKAFDAHIQRLAVIGASPKPLEFIDAGIDQLLYWMKLRRGWYGYPA